MRGQRKGGHEWHGQRCRVCFIAAYTFQERPPHDFDFLRQAICVEYRKEKTWAGKPGSDQGQLPSEREADYSGIVIATKPWVNETEPTNTQQRYRRISRSGSGKVTLRGELAATQRTRELVCSFESCVARQLLPSL